MLFEIKNTASSGGHRSTHCGVMEFSAQEGRCYLPYWMMQNLLLREGDIVKVANVSLKKATYVKFRPRTKDFLDISNPKAVLEKSLRTYTCMTKGDQFCIAYNDKKYFIDVLDVRPDGKASIIETDVSIDFAPPADYVEPTAKKKTTAASNIPLRDGATKSGDGQGSAAPKKDGFKNIADLERGKKPSDDVPPPHVPFSGKGQRLDGKTMREEQKTKINASTSNAHSLAALAEARRKRSAEAAEARRKRNERKANRADRRKVGKRSQAHAFGGAGRSLGSGTE